MAKASTYIKDIRAQVRADHGGKVPDHLNLTIRNYANALEMRDTLQAEIAKEGATITEVGSMGQVVKRQHPLMPSLYQWETLVQKYAKDLTIWIYSHGQCPAAIHTTAACQRH